MTYDRREVVGVANRAEVADKSRHDGVSYVCRSVGWVAQLSHHGVPSAVMALRFGPRIGAILSMTRHSTSAYYNKSNKREEK